MKRNCVKSARVVLALLVCSTITLAAERKLPLPPASCAGLYVGTWEYDRRKTVVLRNGTARPSENVVQQWTCNGNKFMVYIPETGRILTQTLSADGTTLDGGSPFPSTRISKPPNFNRELGEQKTKEKCGVVPTPAKSVRCTQSNEMCSCITLSNSCSYPVVAMYVISGVKPLSVDLTRKNQRETVCTSRNGAQTVRLISWKPWPGVVEIDRLLDALDNALPGPSP
jgi:hypothetical protein